MKKKKKNLKTLKTFTMTVTYYLGNDNIGEALKCLNLHHFGDEVCNRVVDGQIVAKYPEKETPEVLDSYCNVHRTYTSKIKVDLMEDGTLKLKK